MRMVLTNIIKVNAHCCDRREAGDQIVKTLSSMKGRPQNIHAKTGAGALYNGAQSIKTSNSSIFREKKRVSSPPVQITIMSCVTISSLLFSGVITISDLLMNEFSAERSILSN